MAKQKKKHKKKNETSSVKLTPAGEVKAQLKRFNWKRAVIIALSMIAAFAVYEVLIALPSLRVGDIPIIMPVYIGIVAVLMSAVVVLNSGFSTKPITVDMLRSDENEDEAELASVCEKLNGRKKIAKKLMMLLIPFLFALFFDMIYLFYGDFFKGAVEYLSGGSK